MRPTTRKAMEEAAKRRWNDETKRVTRWTKKWAPKRQPVADVRYLVPVKPLGSYVQMFKGIVR